MACFSRNQILKSILHMKCWETFIIKDIHFSVLHAKIKRSGVAFLAYILLQTKGELEFSYME